MNAIQGLPAVMAVVTIFLLALLFAGLFVREIKWYVPFFVGTIIIVAIFVFVALFIFLHDCYQTLLK